MSYFSYVMKVHNSTIHNRPLVILGVFVFFFILIFCESLALMYVHDDLLIKLNNCVGIGTLQIDPHFPKGITIYKPSEHYRYNCTISTINKTEITISFTQQDHTEKDSLESDTTYVVHCIAYDENGSEACFEANGTVKTCEHLVMISQPLQYIYSVYVCAVVSVVPGKITEVNISKTKVMGDEVEQYFTWISPNSSAKYSYIIKYGNAANVTSPNGTSVMTKNITVTKIKHTYTKLVVLTVPTSIYTKNVSLSTPTSRVTYNFWIAANSSAGIGEYSDRVQITYDGKFDVELE